MEDLVALNDLNTVIKCADHRLQICGSAGFKILGARLQLIVLHGSH